MTRYLIAYAVMLALFPALDLAWFTGVAHGFYQSQIGALLEPTLKIVPTVAFYVLYSAGTLIFVVAPTLDRGGWRRTAGLGAVFGLVAYGAYDLTNLATLKGFPLAVCLVDMGWGAVATAVAASLGQLIARRLGETARPR